MVCRREECSGSEQVSRVCELGTDHQSQDPRTQGNTHYKEARGFLLQSNHHHTYLSINYSYTAQATQNEGSQRIQTRSSSSQSPARTTVSSGSPTLST